jgi:hypothetical protein
LGSLKMPAIAPPTDEQAVTPVAPVAPTGAASAVPAFKATPTPDLHTLYEDAANSGDPAAMYSLTAKAKGTPYEGAIRRSAETMNRYVSEFEKDIKPIVAAGGVGTPQGNIAASKVYETIADKPDKTRALVELLIGNDKWRNFLTGGTPTTTLGYDRNGKQLERTVNELGQTISVRDAGTRQLLTPAEVDERGGFLPSLENAIGFQQQKEMSRINTVANEVSTKMANASESVAPVQKAAAQEGGQLFQELYNFGLTDKQRREIGLFSTQQTSRSLNRSAAINGLSQAISSTDNKVGAEYTEALKPALAALGLKLGADRSIQNSSGQTLSKSELEQLQKSLSEGSEFQQQFNQNKADFLANQVFKDLTPEQRAKLGRAMDLQFSLAKNDSDLAGKNQRLPFLLNPAAYQVGDEFHRAEASMLVHEFNADAAGLYAEWRREQLKNYTAKGQLPQPMELESAFARSDEYKQLRSAFKARNEAIFNRPPPINSQPAASKAAVPETPVGTLATESPRALGITVPDVTATPALVERKFSKPNVTPAKAAAPAAATGLLPTEGEAASALSRVMKRPALTDLIKKHGGR